MHQLLNIYKLMSDETRLRILILLYKNDLCVCQLSGILEAPQPRISKNLSKLRDLDLVTDERQEKFVYYSLKKDNKALTAHLDWILEHVNDYPEIVSDIAKVSNKSSYYPNCSTKKI